MEIVHEEAVAAIDRQIGAVESMRSRGSTILAAASIVTTFFGSAAIDLDGDQLTIWSKLAMGAFVALSALTLAMLFPRKWRWSQHPSKLLSDYVEDESPATEDELLRELSLHRESDFRANETRIQAMAWQFNAAVLFLALEVVFWTADLMAR